MKNILKASLLLAFCLTLISASCKKGKTGIDGLPPATQTGEQTFGCLVNGVLFKPKGNWSGTSPEQASYQLVDGNLYFAVSGTNKSNRAKLLSVRIQSLNIELKTGMIIPLVEGVNKEASSSYEEFEVGFINEYKTNSMTKGELKITRFDNANQIVSGTFWFDAVNKTGGKVEVREGRFDMRFIK